MTEGGHHQTEHEGQQQEAQQQQEQQQEEQQQQKEPEQQNGDPPSGPPSGHELHQEKPGSDKISPSSTTITAGAGMEHLERPSVADSTASGGAVFKGRTIVPEMVKAFDTKLRGMSAKMKHLGQTLAPWTVVDNKARAKKVAEALEQDRVQVVEVMTRMMEGYREASHEASEARLALADREEKERAAKQQAEQLEKANEEVESLREFKRSHSSYTRHLLEKVETINISRMPQQHTGAGEDTQDSELRQRVEVLLVEHERLTAEAEKALKAKQDMEKKWKELQSRAADDSEVKGREIKQLQTTVRKVEEKKDSEVAAAKKEVAEMREQRKKDQDLMQRRLNSSKVEVDGYKAREKAAKAQLDEAIASAARAQEDLKTAKSRMADTRAAKDDLQRYLDTIQYEAALVADEYRELVQSVVRSQGFSALPCAQQFVNHSAPYPRTAFTTKNGRVLYNRAIHKGIDVSKVVPREYNSHKELQEMIVEEGLVLDKQCGPETF
ncbi:hypothetical protein DUNSADRAFT_13662 [Dunaliella salina]|uniref:Uncharacterized protein n=1 Tax=Dunaliella salina TaxID=3046 RepID=A0ABQ7G8Y0_DUNSA|nr:hypothetical protein DUNSADRAFT_13662 [Dunaliella salina]|eukprot:KAF5831051.1 hypothetical protein DUNSADRAFT_13662 [Dunaliella salina]